MTEPRYGLTDEQWNSINEEALRVAAESFAKHPSYRFSRADVAAILTGAADENPTKGNR